jgi:3-methylcrotonyl-CoA carboxylase alpha subunit
MRSEWRDGPRTRRVELEPEGAGRYRVTVDAAELTLTVEVLEHGRIRVETPEGVTTAEVTAVGSRRFVRWGNMDFVFERMLGARSRGATAADGGLEAPMPGVVTRVLVAAGEVVKRGQPLVAVEAMKMEHVVRAPRDGRVRSLRVQQGELVQGGAELIDLDDATPGP